MKAVRVHVFGGPEALVYEEAPVPTPGPGQALVKIAVSGLNFIDVQHRAGRYKIQLPFTVGSEGAGTVEAVGDGVTDVKKGDRVAYVMIPGSYAEYAVVPAARLVPLPDGIDFQSAAAVMLQGLTAHYLTHSTYPLTSGEYALVHAGAGGAGLMITQIARKRGAHVIATVGTEAKAELAKQAGANDVVVYTRQDFEVEVKRITGGRGVDVVYDSVGKDTFDRSLNCLRPRGYLAQFGFSSGPVAPIDPATLGYKGAVFLTRPMLNYYIATRDELLARSRDLFAWLAAKELSLRIDRVVPLADAGKAHAALEARQTSGKVLFTT